MRKKTKTSVKGLKTVKLLEGAPHWLRESKAKGVQRKGLVYEKHVGDYLVAWLGEDRVLRGPWFEYEDASGKAWCQPDYIVLATEDEPMLIIEVKLSYRKGAKSKLRDLYEPVAKRVWKPKRGIPVKRIQVCKGLGKGFKEELIERKDVYTKDFRYAIWNVRKT